MWRKIDPVFSFIPQILQVTLSRWDLAWFFKFVTSLWHSGHFSFFPWIFRWIWRDLLVNVLWSQTLQDKNVLCLAWQDCMCSISGYFALKDFGHKSQIKCGLMWLDVKWLMKLMRTEKSFWQKSHVYGPFKVRTAGRIVLRDPCTFSWCFFQWTLYTSRFLNALLQI